MFVFEDESVVVAEFGIFSRLAVLYTKLRSILHGVKILTEEIKKSYLYYTFYFL